jgi:hypothetical protein
MVGSKLAIMPKGLFSYLASQLWFCIPVTIRSSYSNPCDMESESEEILSCFEKEQFTEEYLSSRRLCEHRPQSGK